MSLGAGVDVGGTKIAGCIADLSTGDILAYDRVPSQTESGGRAVLAAAAGLIRRLAAGRELASVGIGLCELVDLDGRVTSAYTVDWRELDIEDPFRDIAPVRLESDVRAAALAEARFGCGRGVTLPWLYVTIGTGISFCLVVDGRPYAGAHGNAHLLGAPMVETISSGLALQRATGLRSAEEVLSDEQSAPLVAHAAAALGRAMAVLVNALDPAIVVVGGGLGLERPYREAVVEVMRAAVELPPSRDVPVSPAELAGVGGALGAALAAAPR